MYKYFFAKIIGNNISFRKLNIVLRKSSAKNISVLSIIEFFMKKMPFSWFWKESCSFFLTIIEKIRELYIFPPKMLPSKADLCIFPPLLPLANKTAIQIFSSKFLSRKLPFFAKKDSGPNTCFFSCLSHIRIFFKSNHPWIS